MQMILDSPTSLPANLTAMHPTAAREIKALTGIRFFAAFWVVLFHFREEMFALVPGLKWMMPFVGAGYQAVPLFFILSGFILSYTYFERYSLMRHGHFVYLRFARIWPVHAAAIVALLVYLGVLAFFHRTIDPDNYSFSSLPFELAMIRSWASENLIWNYPAWSVQCEWFAYLFLFPIAFLCFRREERPWFLCVTIAALVSLHTFLPMPHFLGKLKDILFLFFAGSALYRLRVLFPDLPGHWASVIGLILTGIGIGTSRLFSPFLVHTGFGLLVFGLSYERGLLNRLLSMKAIVYGGILSYSVYMTHALVQKAFGPLTSRLAVHSQVGGFLLFVTGMAMVFFVAMLFHHCVEAPCNRWLRQSFARNHQSI